MLQYQKVQSNAGKSYKVLLIYFTSSISQFRKYEIIIMERYFTANPSFYENVARLTLFIYEIALSYLNCLHLMNMDWDSSHDVMRPMSLFGSNTDQQVNNILTMSEWFWCNSFSPPSSGTSGFRMNISTQSTNPDLWMTSTHIVYSKQQFLSKQY